MKEMIVSALAAAGIQTDGLDEDALLKAYSQLQANQSKRDAEDTGEQNGIAEVVASALKPLAEKIEGLQSKLNSKEQSEIDNLASIVANSGKYAGLDIDSCKLLGVDKLKEMAANCSAGFGLSPMINTSGAKDTYSAPSDMPE